MSDPERDSSDEATQHGTDPLQVAVGARIRTLREAVGLRQIDAARAAGITKGYLWRMEEGRQNMSLRSLSRIALAIGATMSEILEGVAADPSTLGTRAFEWRDGKDPRPPAGRKRNSGSATTGDKPTSQDAVDNPKSPVRPATAPRSARQRSARRQITPI